MMKEGREDVIGMKGFVFLSHVSGRTSLIFMLLAATTKKLTLK